MRCLRLAKAALDYSHCTSHQPACTPCVLLRRLQRFYTHLHSYLMAGRFADRLQPWLDAFGPDK